MQIHISSDYESMSKKCAHDLLSYVADRKNPVVCTASGDTPKGMYKQLIKIIKDKQIDVSHWYFISLDEWAGMNGNDEGSCRHHLNKDLFEPLHVDKKKIIFFDGRADDLEAEALRTENDIKNLGGINVAIAGIGTNGHIGMNEPGTDARLRCHIAEIHEATSQAGQKYFTTKKALTHGITLGIANLMETGFLMILANGNKKADIIQKVLQSQPTVQLPASILAGGHKNVSVYLDKEAAISLETNA